MIRMQWQKYEDYLKSFEEEKDRSYFELENEGNTKTLQWSNVQNESVIPAEVRNPFKYYKFWKCVTNFFITDAVAKVITETPGVEIFRPTTNYSFLIAFGVLFYDEEEGCLQLRKELLQRLKSDPKLTQAGYRPNTQSGDGPSQ